MNPVATAGSSWSRTGSRSYVSGWGLVEAAIPSLRVFVVLQGLLGVGMVLAGTGVVVGLLAAVGLTRRAAWLPGWSCPTIDY